MVEESVYTIRGWLWKYKPCWLGENRKQLPSSFARGVISLLLQQLLVVCTSETQMHSQKVLWTPHSVLSASSTPKSLSNFTVNVWKTASFWKEVFGCVNKRGCTTKAGWWVWVLGNGCICRINSCITKKYLGLSKQIITNVKLIKNSFSCPGKCSCSAKISNAPFLLFCLVLGFQVYNVNYCIFRQDKICLIQWRQICRGFSDFNE